MTSATGARPQCPNSGVKTSAKHETCGGWSPPSMPRASRASRRRGGGKSWPQPQQLPRTDHALDALLRAGITTMRTALNADVVSVLVTNEAGDFPDLHGVHPAANVIRTGETRWSTDMTDAFLLATTSDKAHFSLVKALGFRSYVTVPLVGEEDVLGALTVVSMSRARTGRRLLRRTAGWPCCSRRRQCRAIRGDSANLPRAATKSPASEPPEGPWARRRLQVSACNARSGSGRGLLRFGGPSRRKSRLGDR
jgi:hypothetical protein